MKSRAITESDYKKLLAEIQKNLQKTQQKIVRQKVEMAWEIGKLVEEHLLKNGDETYGKNLILRLAQDSKVSTTALYKMRSFFQTYKKLPKDDPQLNWSHYRVLAGVTDKDERKYLEDLTRENEWTANVLQKKVTEIKPKKITKNKAKKTVAVKKLKVSRGKLFTYQLAEINGSKEMFVDLGFNIFSKIKTNLAVGEIVTTTKNGEKYSLKKSTVTKKEMHTYKAYLERVVDGDTIHVTLDLGFGIFHKEILRLAQINAPEIDSAEGKKSCLELKNILRDVEFLVIKTSKTDIYGRYIADVFLGVEEKYLNQMLLDLGVVEFVQY